MVGVMVPVTDVVKETEADVWDEEVEEHSPNAEAHVSRLLHVPSLVS